MEPHLYIALSHNVSLMYRDYEGDYCSYEFVEDELIYSTEDEDEEPAHNMFLSRIWRQYEFSDSDSGFMNYANSELKSDDCIFWGISEYRMQTLKQETMAFVLNGKIRWVGNNLMSMLKNVELLNYFNS